MKWKMYDMKLTYPWKNYHGNEIPKDFDPNISNTETACVKFNPSKSTNQNQLQGVRLQYKGQNRLKGKWNVQPLLSMEELPWKEMGW